MLIFSDGTLKPLIVRVGAYTWDVGEGDFKCEIRHLSPEKLKAVWEIVKQYEWYGKIQPKKLRKTPHISTSNPGEPYSCDITVTCELNNTGDALDTIYTFQRFSWETWDSDTNSIKLTGEYRGPYDTIGTICYID